MMHFLLPPPLAFPRAKWGAQTYQYWRRTRRARNDVIYTYTLKCEAAPRSLFLTQQIQQITGSAF